MKVVEHKLEGCTFDPSQNIRGPITPRVIVMHYTATPSAAGAIRTLKDTTRGRNCVSAHLVVDLDGTITQLVPFTTKAWHAGDSHLDTPSGRITGLNSHSIGIEIVNLGYARRTEEGRYIQDGRDVTAHLNGVQLIQAPWDRVGSGAFFWPVYPEAQLDAVEAATRALLEAYPSIEYIVGHSDISVRKSDPGPAFPMARFQRMVANRGSDDDDVVFVPAPAPPIVVTPGQNTEMQPAPTQPQPQPPLARSRTIWGAIVAFFAGLAMFVRELFRDPTSAWANMKQDFINAYGIDPVWILLAIFVFAIALIIYARLDDRAKRKR
jgi:N-acetylmuramoyl-L-alanine amidase